MIGNLLRLVGSDLACNDLIPFRTPSSFGYWAWPDQEAQLRSASGVQPKCSPLLYCVRVIR